MKNAIYLGLIAGLGVFGCREKGKEPKDMDPAGTYTLVTVDGSAVPAEVTHGEAKLRIESGIFTIQGDGTCSSSIVFVPPNGTNITRVVNATYTRANDTLTMQWEGAGTTEGTLTGDTFSMTNEGMVFGYKKQP